MATPPNNPNQNNPKIPEQLREQANVNPRPTYQKPAAPPSPPPKPKP